ncbi:MAG: CBS domain containing-hemolysin-like protein [Parvicellaceae bacterium]
MVGLIDSKTFIGVSGSDKHSEYLNEGDVLSVTDTLRLDNLLNHFIKTRKHHALVYDS